MAKFTSVDQAAESWADRDCTNSSDSVEVVQYSRYISRKILFILIFTAVTFLAAGISLYIGNYSISFSDCYVTVWEHITGNIRTDSHDDFIIWDMRLPRVIKGIFGGIALAAAGAVMQTILRNPLADPYTTGISSGALFGATLAMGLGISVAGLGTYAIIGNAFIFSLIPMAIIIAVSKMRNASPTTMVMAGIAVMYIFNAITTMIRLWLDPDTQSAIYAWTVGTLDGIGWDGLWIMLSVTTAGVAVMCLLSRRLNVLATGDETATSMGIDPNRLRLIALLLVSMVTASVVSFTGLIGFIGLVCPHIARMFVGSDCRFLIPASAVLGSSLLLFADVIGRVVLAPQIIQVGVITAFIGGPLFLYLIIKRCKNEAF